MSQSYSLSEEKACTYLSCLFHTCILVANPASHTLSIYLLKAKICPSHSLYLCYRSIIIRTLTNTKHTVNRQAYKDLFSWSYDWALRLWIAEQIKSKWKAKKHKMKEINIKWKDENAYSLCRGGLCGSPVKPSCAKELQSSCLRVYL